LLGCGTFQAADALVLALSGVGVFVRRATGQPDHRRPSGWSCKNDASQDISRHSGSALEHRSGPRQADLSSKPASGAADAACRLAADRRSLLIWWTVRRFRASGATRIPGRGRTFACRRCRKRARPVFCHRTRSRIRDRCGEAILSNSGKRPRKL